VIARVGAKIGGLVGPVDQLQAKHSLGEIDRGRKVTCPLANVSKLVDLDHAARPLETRSQEAPQGGASLSE